MSWVRMDKGESEIGYKQSFILSFAQRSIEFSYCKKRCHFLNYTGEIETKNSWYHLEYQDWMTEILNSQDWNKKILEN